MTLMTLMTLNDLSLDKYNAMKSACMNDSERLLMRVLVHVLLVETFSRK